MSEPDLDHASSADSADETTEAISARRRAIRFGAVGTVIEWYDYLVYASLAPVFAQVFFPTDNRISGLLATYGVFASGYLIRPLGAIFFGHIGDRAGRRKALIGSLALMAVAMAGIAVLPTASTLGAIATGLFVLTRLIQGFSVGGELTGTLTLLIEYAKPKRRGLTTSAALVALGIGLMLATGIVAIIHLTLSDALIESWGWRIPYIFGTVLVAASIVLRARVDETPVFEELKRQGRLTRIPLREVLVSHLPALLRTTLIAGFIGLAFYIVFGFLVGFRASILDKSGTDAVLATLVGAAIYAGVTPFAAWVSDRIGRRVVLLSGTIALAVSAYPVFLVISSSGFAGLIGATALLSAEVAWASGASMVAITEMFHARERLSGLSVGYNIGNTILGGTAPLVATWLVSVSGSNTAPSLYLVAVAIGAAIVIWLMPETAPVRASGREEVQD